MKRKITSLTTAIIVLCVMLIGLPGKGWADDVTATLTGSDMVIGNNPSTSYTDYTSSGATDDDDNVWYGRWCYQNSNGILQMMQIRSYTNSTDNGNCSRLNVPTFGGTIKTITLSITGTSATSASGTGTSATLYLATSYSKTAVGAILTDESNSNRKSVEFDLTTLDDDYTGEGLYLLANGGVRIWSVAVVYTPSSGSDLTDEELSWSAASFTANIGQSNTYPTLTNTHDLAVTYQSTDESVATINSSGVISLLDEGITTIKAVFVGNSTYNAKTVTYALTVVDPSLTTIWSENFSGYAADAVPSGLIPNPHTGTTAHGGVTITYACTNGGGTTKIYENASTGGESPELLVGKSNGTFSATIPLTTASYGFSGDLVLRFKMNANELNVKTTTDGITVDGEENEGEGVSFSTSGSHKVIFEGVTNSTESITVVFTATSSSNVRIDDIVLRGTQAEFTKVATPEISPASGAVIPGTEISITCSTPGASIYYTTDNSTPTNTSTAYNPSSKPTITSAMTIKAIAIKDGLTDSDVASVSYTIAEPCETPTFSPAAGEVEKGTTVTISTETDGATIYYTTNGSTPTTSSTEYDPSNKPTINAATNIKAIAAKAGMANSEVASASYTIKDYATLPFVWTGGNTTSGGGKDDLTAMTGVTASGLGSDYAQSNAPYRIKFDSKDDYIRIKLDGQPARITIAVKMLGGGTTSKIKVQESATGESFTDIEELTIAGASNAVLEFDIANAFSATTRYVKIIKSVHGSNVGVGPIVIYKTTKIAPNPTWTPSDFTPVANNVYVISGDNTLTLNGDFSSKFNDPEILVVEDGGQLIVNHSGVQATIQKRLPSGSSKATNWTTIASPVKNISIGDTDEDGDVLHLKDVDFALYRLNEATPEWENYKNTAYHNGGADDFETLEAGRGYLYSRNELATLEYVGAVNGDDYTEYSLTKSSNDNAGFHLIGNPYSHDIYKGEAENGYAIPNSPEDGTSGYVLADGFYRLKNGTSWASSLDDGTKIESGEGILVQATTAGTLRIYNSDTKPAPAKGRANNDNIMFTVANSQYDDVAYALFKKGVGLTKINHRDENVPMIYINQDGEDFAIATMSDDTKSFNLNFKAMTIGMYKLGLKPEGNFTYIHVIDKLTGEDIDMLLEGEYNFIGSPKDIENRFIVRLGYMPNSNEDSNDIFAYQSGSEIYVTGSGELQIFDVTGRRVMTTTINGSESISIPNQGVYIFKLNEKVQKIVVR